MDISYEEALKRLNEISHLCSECRNLDDAQAIAGGMNHKWIESDPNGCHLCSVEGRDVKIKNLEEELKKMNQWYCDMRDEQYRCHEKIREYKDILQQILDCPKSVDEATIPKEGVQAAPEQVVFNMSIGLMRINKIQELLRD